MKLCDLARSSSNSATPLPAFHVFWSRSWNRDPIRRSRKSYESLPLCAFSHYRGKRPWSLFLGFFLVLAILGPLLPSCLDAS